MNKLTPIGLALALVVTGCAAPQTNTGKGAAYGAGGGALAGAVAGGLVGGNARSTLIGAALGAAVGGAAGAGIGHMMDQQELEYREALAASQAASVRREGELLAITLHGDVFFDTNSAIVRSGLYREIDRIAQVMVRYPTMVIMVEGFTDSTGSETYNLQLSQRRAEAVRDLLIARGVDSAKIRAIGYGESRPVANNSTREGRQSNRRVEIRIQP